MKKLFKSILLVMLTFTTYGQNTNYSSCDSCDTASRFVTNMGILAWHGTFNALIDSSIIGGTPSIYPYICFTKSSLDSLYNVNPNDTINASSTGTIMFNFYLDESNTPQIALSDCSNPGTYLIANDTFVDQRTLQTSFNNWDTLNNSLYGLVLVDYYSTCWSKVAQGIINAKSNYLCVTILAHTVSPLDTHMYQLPANGFEGYVAFDIVISYSTYPTSSFSSSRTSDALIDPKKLYFGLSTSYSDFAAPCPKNCYSN